MFGCDFNKSDHCFSVSRLTFTTSCSLTRSYNDNYRLLYRYKLS